MKEMLVICEIVGQSGGSWKDLTKDLLAQARDFGEGGDGTAGSDGALGSLVHD